MGIYDISRSFGSRNSSIYFTTEVDACCFQKLFLMHFVLFLPHVCLQGSSLCETLSTYCTTMAEPLNVSFYVAPQMEPKQNIRVLINSQVTKSHLCLSVLPQRLQTQSPSSLRSLSWSIFSSSSALSPTVWSRIFSILSIFLSI